MTKTKEKSMLRLLLVIVGLVPALAWAEAPYVQHEDVVYGEVHGVALVMDVFVPTGANNGRGIVDVASGAWYSDRGKINDHKRAQMYDIFCGKGYTVFAVRPGSITKFSAAEMVVHLKLGIRWVKERAGKYGIEAESLGLTGASAGGHLACLAAVTPDEAAGGKLGTHVKAAAVFFPPTDFLAYGGNPPDFRSPRTRRLVTPPGGAEPSDEEMKERLTQISPARLVTSKAPPFLLIHGDADILVPLQQSEVMLEALKKSGVPAELIVKKGGGHPWPTIHEEVRLLADWFDGKLCVSTVADKQ
jgi:acetyl esterase/lipase